MTMGLVVSMILVAVFQIATQHVGSFGSPLHTHCATLATTLTVKEAETVGDVLRKLSLRCVFSVTNIDGLVAVREIAVIADEIASLLGFVMAVAGAAKFLG